MPATHAAKLNHVESRCIVGRSIPRFVINGLGDSQDDSEAWAWTLLTPSSHGDQYMLRINAFLSSFRTSDVALRYSSEIKGLYLDTPNLRVISIRTALPYLQSGYLSRSVSCVTKALIARRF